MAPDEGRHRARAVSDEGEAGLRGKNKVRFAGVTDQTREGAAESSRAAAKPERITSSAGVSPAAGASSSSGLLPAANSSLGTPAAAPADAPPSLWRGAPKGMRALADQAKVAEQPIDE